MFSVSKLKLNSQTNDKFVHFYDALKNGVAERKHTEFGSSEGDEDEDEDEREDGYSKLRRGNFDWLLLMMAGGRFSIWHGEEANPILVIL